MDHGEINLSGAKQLANSLKNKKMLTICDLNGNQFGEEGCQELKDIFSGLDRKVLQSLRYSNYQSTRVLHFVILPTFFFSKSDDEGEPSSEEEESEEEEEEESGDEDEEKTEEKVAEKAVEHVSAYNALHQLNANLAQLSANEDIPVFHKFFFAVYFFY